MKAKLATKSRSSRLQRKSTRQGTSLSVLGVAIGLGGLIQLGLGLALNWGESLAAGIFLVLLVGAGLLFTLGRSSYRVDLELAQNRVAVGERAFGQVKISNVGRRGVLPARIEMPVGQSRAEFFLPGLSAGHDHEEIFAIPTRRRAVIEIGPVSSVRSDPMGIARRELVWTHKHDLFVHPEFVQLGSAYSGFMRDLEGQTRNTITDNDMNFHALREYVPGDDRRNIHWKSSARNQNLMVRQFEDTRRTFTAVALDNMASAWGSEAEYELGMSVVASLGVQVLREGMELAVFAGQKRLRDTSPRTFLDQTCGVEMDPIGATYVPPTQVITEQAQQASLAIIVSGSGSSNATHRHLARSMSANLRVLFITCEADATISAHRVGQLTLSTLGSLKDLPFLLRKVALG